jgi:cation diffusion facilitator family transporter
MADSSTKHIIQALIANSVIAVAKGVGTFFTGSGAMAAETIHSVADCANQVLLLFGVKQSEKPADDIHPLGYGRALYFWSFVVALLLFTGGGLYSLYEGVHKTLHPEPLDQVYMALIILGVSLAIEGVATLSNVRELNRRRGATPFFRFLRETKDSDLIVIFGENSAATLGLVLAFIALIVAYLTHNPIYDGIGTVLIGVVLLGVAAFLAAEVKSLLVGESADPNIVAAAKGVADQHPDIHKLFDIITLQQGPGQVLLAAKMLLNRSLSFEQISACINEFEEALRAIHPEVKWMFLEPDFPEGAATQGAGLRHEVLEIAKDTPGIEAVGKLVIMPMGADQLMLGMKVRFPLGLRIEEAEAIIDNLERRVYARWPIVKKIWVEPDDHAGSEAPAAD